MFFSEKDPVKRTRRQTTEKKYLQTMNLTNDWYLEYTKKS